MKIYSSNGNVLLDVTITDDSYRYNELCNEDYIELEFFYNELVDIPIGAYIIYADNDDIYTMYIAPKVEMINSSCYRYTVRLESILSRLKMYIFHNTIDGRISFSLTAKPHEHLAMLVENLNERDGLSADGKPWWSADGNCIDSETKTITYDGVTCYEALQLMAAEFDTEFEVATKEMISDTDQPYTTRSIMLNKVEYEKDNPLALSYGKGNGFVGDITRTADEDAMPVGVMYVKSSNRNINAASYGYTTLQLPVGEHIFADGKFNYEWDEGYEPLIKHKFIVEENKNCVRKEGAVSTVEGSIDCSEIYPHREGTVSAVDGKQDNEGTLYAFTDNANDTNYSDPDIKLEGQSATIVFESGMLAGKEFLLHNYVASEKKFVIEVQNIDGELMPSASYPIAVGDKYAVFNIRVPDEYIRNASKEMLRKAIMQLLREEQQQYLYTGKIDGVWARNNWGNISKYLRCGGYVHYRELDARFMLLRIKAIKSYINNPYCPDITFGDKALKPPYKVSYLITTSKELTASTIARNKQQVTIASNPTISGDINQAIIALRGDDDDLSSEYTICGGRKYTKETADAIIGTQGDVAGKLTLNGLSKQFINFASRLTRDGKSDVIDLLFYGGKNIATDIYLPKPLLAFDPTIDFLKRYTVAEGDKLVDVVDKLEFVKVTTTNHKTYAGATIYIATAVESEDFAEAFGFTLKVGDWLTATSDGWRKISGNTTSLQSIKVDGEEKKPDANGVIDIGSVGVDNVHITEFYKSDITTDGKVITVTPAFFHAVLNKKVILIPNLTTSGRSYVVVESVDYVPGTVLGVDMTLTIRDADVLYICKLRSTNQTLPSNALVTVQEMKFISGSLKSINGNDILGSGDITIPTGVEPLYITDINMEELISNYQNGVRTPVQDGLYQSLSSAASEGRPIYMRYWQGVKNSWILLNITWEDVMYFSCVDTDSNVITGDIAGDGILISDISNIHQVTEAMNQVTEAMNEVTELVNDFNSDLSTLYDVKQDVLVSGETIKTINGEPLLGSGNITISGGGGGEGSALTEDDIANMGFTKNVGTVTSVAGISPVDGNVSASDLYSGILSGIATNLRGPAVSGGLTPGKIEIVNVPVTSFSIIAFYSMPNRPVEEYTVHFVTSAEGCKFSLPSSVKWAGEKPDMLPPNTCYELNIVKTMISGTSYFKAVLTPFV